MEMGGGQLSCRELHGRTRNRCHGRQRTTQTDRPLDPHADRRDAGVAVPDLPRSIFFEMWSRIAYGVSFVFNTYNLQSISVFATTPLLLALGQTFVIISAGIDLSLGFVMGLASVIAAHVANYAALQLGLAAFSGHAGRHSRRHLR